MTGSDSHNGSDSPGPLGVALVAEDDPINQVAATRMLRKRGFDVDVASNGRDALEMVNHRRYDLIFMDCEMPQLDGYEATAEIRRREGACREATIIAMTAGTRAGDRERCLSAGMDDYLTKPFDLIHLDEIINGVAWSSSLASTATAAADDGLQTTPLTVLDPRLLSEICEGDQRSREQLVAMFCDHARDAVAELSQALAAGDVAAISRTAHTLSGSAAVFGAGLLSVAAGRLFETAAAGRLTELPAEQAGLEFAYERTLRELRRTTP